MRLFALVFILTILFFTGQAQISQLDTSQIHLYASSLDSNKTFKIAIKEGSIINRHNKTIGGFGVRAYHDKFNDSIYKIEYHHNCPKNAYFTFYFKGNKLILAKERLEHDGQGDVIYHFEYFFQNDTLISSSGAIFEKKYKKYIVGEAVLLIKAYKMLSESDSNKNW